MSDTPKPTPEPPTMIFRAAVLRWVEIDPDTREDVASSFSLQLHDVESGLRLAEPVAGVYFEGGGNYGWSLAHGIRTQVKRGDRYDGTAASLEEAKEKALAAYTRTTSAPRTPGP